jgi:uncharacterized spore protein YtfJ
MEIIKEADMGRIIGQKVKSTGKIIIPVLTESDFHEFVL